MDFIVDKVLMPVLVILVIAMLALLAFLPFDVYASNVCLQNGYPNGYVVLPYEIKCGRIVNQTEYICPLSDVLSNSCLPIEGGN
jgi:hypothetical protein